MEELEVFGENGGENSTVQSKPPFWRRFLSRTSQLWSQLTISEISGSFGDLGTFIPLVVALARKDAIRLGPTLFLAGVSNVTTGAMWDIPMCVQPMKSIAAVAIAEGLSRAQVTAAGIWMGLFLILLSLSNGIELVNLLVPTAVVSGIQMGVGINLAIRGILMIQDLSWFHDLDCILLAIACAFICMILLREKEPQENGISGNGNDHHQRRQPSAPVGVYLFGLGILLAAVHLHNRPEDQDNPTFQLFGEPIMTWALKGVSWHDWKQGLLEGALPQLPLTTLNSVVSVCCLAHTLYPEKRRQQEGDDNNSSSDLVVSRQEVSWSVGLMNLLLCPLGAMPCCHGAGGLAGQHKFGARHGASVVFLGVNKMIISSLLGGSLLVLLDAIPIAILGVMLVISGHELAMSGFRVLVQCSRASEDSDAGQQQFSSGTLPNSRASLRKNSVVALITVIIDVGLHKTHYAALTGWVVYVVYADGIQTYLAQWDRRSSDNDMVDYAVVAQHEEDDLEVDVTFHDALDSNVEGEVTD